MKKMIAVLLCCVLFVLCGCNEQRNTEIQKYKRISFASEYLGEEADSINAETDVIYNAKETFKKQIPIYEISKRNITEEENRNLKEALGIEDWYLDGYDDGEIHSLLAPYNEPSRGYFCDLEMTDDELEKLAWETFNKIPFMEGEYEYLGVSSTYTVWTMDEGEYVQAVMVSFRRLLNGVRVVGNDVCDLTFDGSGLQEMHISLYNYKEIGTMDMVNLEEAENRVKEPDSFSMDKEGTAKVMQVDRVKLLLINQYSRGCTILQPIYNFIGTATLEDGTQTDFSSKVIAIPESMTYEEE